MTAEGKGMRHFLTVGFICEAAACKGQLCVLAPLNERIVARLVDQYRDDTTSGEITFEQERVFVDQGCVRCLLFTPRLNRTSVRFILALQATTRCVIADIEHARIVTPAELTELLSHPRMAEWRKST